MKFLAEWYAVKLPDQVISRVDIATFVFITKCMGVLYALHSGVPALHHEFWEGFSVQELYKLYKVLNATPQRVLKLLKEPEFLTASQQRVFGYLTTFIGNLKQEELSSWL